MSEGGRYPSRWLLCVCVCNSTCVDVYLFQELHSVPQALYLLRHILHHAETSSYKKTHKYRQQHQRMAFTTYESDVVCSILFFRALVLIWEDSFKHIALMNLFTEWFMVTAASLYYRCEGEPQRSRGNLGRGGKRGCGKRLMHKLKERSPDIDDHSPPTPASTPSPVNMHWLWRSVCLPPPERNVPATGRIQICSLAVLRQTNRERLNLSQMWSITETGVSWETGWGGGRRHRGERESGDDPQQTGLMELEWEHKCWPRVKRGRWKGKSPTLLRSSLAQPKRSTIL